jgi:hypothetical protein
MGAGPTPQQISAGFRRVMQCALEDLRAMKTGDRTIKLGDATAACELIRASNGEAAIVWRATFAGKTSELRLSVRDALSEVGAPHIHERLEP